MHLNISSAVLAAVFVTAVTSNLALGAGTLHNRTTSGPSSASCANPEALGNANGEAVVRRNHNSDVTQHGHDRLASGFARREWKGSDQDAKQYIKAHPKRAPPRAPSPDELRRNIARGQRLICMMQDPSTAGTKGSSQFLGSDFGLLEQWGWDVNAGKDADLTVPDYTTVPGIQGLVGKEQPTQLTMRHKRLADESLSAVKAGVAKGYEYPPTNAYLTNAYFPNAGVIIAENNWSPKGMVDIMSTSKFTKWNHKKDRIPDLCQLSDIWWLSWLHIAKTPKPIRYIIRRHLYDSDMHDLLAHVLFKNGVRKGKIGAWPGTKVMKGDEGFDALVGSPNVWGVAWLLIQRGEALGRKEIKSITVYREGPEGGEGSNFLPNLLIEIEAVGE